MIPDALSAIYPWVKAFHIMAVISWMAGLFYLPRLFVHHAESAPVGGEASELLKKMERKLLKIIINPASIAVWISGITLVSTPGIVDLWSPNWFHVKFLAVCLMTGFHHWLVRCQKQFERDENKRPGKSYRMMNEVPTLLMIVIVFMVVVRPF